MTHLSPKVVWVSRQLPAPPESGDRIYSRGLALSLAATGLHVTFLGLTDPEAATADLQSLPPGIDWVSIPGRPFGRLRTLASVLPFEAKRFATRAYQTRLRRMLNEDQGAVIVLDHYSAAWALPLLKGRGRRIVTIAHNFETALSRQIARDYRGGVLQKIALKLNARRTAAAEKRLVEEASLVVALTEEDLLRLQELGAQRGLTLSPGYSGEIEDIAAPVAPDHRVVLLGSYRWVAKQMNLRAFLKAADGRFAAAGIKLDVIGALPERLKAELEPGLQATRFLGFVDDPGPFLRSARIGVVPEATGGGFKLKTLDYTFAGLVVAALGNALEGVPAPVRRHMLSAATLDDLVSQICEVISQDQVILYMRNAALRESAAIFDWRSRGEALRRALDL